MWPDLKHLNYAQEWQLYKLLPNKIWIIDSSWESLCSVPSVKVALLSLRYFVGPRKGRPQVTSQFIPADTSLRDTLISVDMSLLVYICWYVTTWWDLLIRHYLVRPVDTSIPVVHTCWYFDIILQSSLPRECSRCIMGCVNALTVLSNHLPSIN